MEEIEQALQKTIGLVGSKLKEKKEMLATAESCTGGWVGEVITSVPGTSHWYDRGFITYSNAAKREMLGVSTDTLTRFGAVSEQTARSMVEGALQNSQARYALSITGIAGPEGGTPEKPVGYVCFAWGGHNRETVSECVRFDGDRQQVRLQAVQHSLDSLVRFIG
jgi:nicotinamide-nucleotide amidase